MSPEASLAGLLLETTVKGSLLLILVAVVALVLRRSPAAHRHLVWAMGVISLLVLPLLVLGLPDWRVPLPERAAGVLPRVIWESPPTGAREQGTARVEGALSLGRLGPEGPTSTRKASEPRAEAAAPPPAARPPALGLAGGIVLLWLVGALAVAASFALAWPRLSRTARHAVALESPRWRTLVEAAAESVGLDARKVTVRRATGPLTPLTWGVRRPVVILPPSCEDWTDAQAGTVLVHEISHIRRHDCLTQTLASLACVLHWFNPLAWLAGRRMLTERERACDDQVLLAGAKASDYANDLLEIARSLGAPWPTSQVSTAMARRSQIAGRLLAVLDPHLARGGASRGRVAVAAAFGLALLVPFAGVRAAPPTALIAEESSPPLRAEIPVDLARVGGALDAQNEGLAAALRRGDTEALSLY